METKRQHLQEAIVLSVREIGEVLFNIHSDEQFYNVFGIDAAQLESIVLKIVKALPDALFAELNSRQLKELKNICAREYVFFQIQERWDDPLYQQHLEKFAEIFAHDMQLQLTKITSKQKG